MNGADELVSAFVLYAGWLKDILKSLDGTMKYEERLLHFKFADGNRIADEILERCHEMLEIPVSLNPTYGLGA